MLKSCVILQSTRSLLLIQQTPLAGAPNLITVVLLQVSVQMINGDDWLGVIDHLAREPHWCPRGAQRLSRGCM